MKKIEVGDKVLIKAIPLVDGNKNDTYYEFIGKMVTIIDISDKKYYFTDSYYLDPIVDKDEFEVLTIYRTKLWKALT